MDRPTCATCVYWEELDQIYDNCVPAGTLKQGDIICVGTNGMAVMRNAQVVYVCEFKEPA